MQFKELMLPAQDRDEDHKAVFFRFSVGENLTLLRSHGH